MIRNFCVVSYFTSGTRKPEMKSTRPMSISCSALLQVHLFGPLKFVIIRNVSTISSRYTNSHRPPLPNKI